MAVARTHATGAARSVQSDWPVWQHSPAAPGPPPAHNTTQQAYPRASQSGSPSPSPIPASRARPEPRRSLPPKVRHRAGGRPVVFVPCRPHGCLPVCCLGVCCSGRLALACSGFKRNAFRPLPLSSAPLDPPIATSSDPPHDWGWTN